MFQANASALQNTSDLNSIRVRTRLYEFAFVKPYYFGLLASKISLCCTKYFNRAELL